MRVITGLLVVVGCGAALVGSCTLLERAELKGRREVAVWQDPAGATTPVVRARPAVHIDRAALRDANPLVRQAECRRLLDVCYHLRLRGPGWPYQGTPEVVAALVEMLQDPDEGVRYEVGTCFVNMVEETIIPKIIDALESPNPAFRLGAAELLVRIGGGFPHNASPAVPPLTRALADPVEDVRIAAARALISIGEETPDALRVLAEGLQSPDRRVIWAALKGLADCRYLGDRKPAALVGNLVKLLRDADSEVRSSAASCLGQCEDKDAAVFAALSSALGDEQKDVRLSAAGAFSHLRFPQTPAQVFAIICEELMSDQLDWNSRLYWCWALERLDQFPPCVVKALHKCLSDPNSEVQLEAARVIARDPAKRTEAAKQTLLELIRSDKLNSDKKLRAIEILRSLERGAGTPAPLK